MDYYDCLVPVKASNRMNVQTRFLKVLSFGCAALTTLAEPQQAKHEDAASAPPTPPPMIFSTEPASEPGFRAAANLYSIGEPTPEEQLYVEMINRARANPQAGGAECPIDGGGSPT